MLTLHRPRTGNVGLAPGAFDLLHVGHLNLLRRAAERCDHLVAGVVSDRLVHIRKGHLPVLPQAERAALVQALDCVDSVIVDDEADRTVTWARHGISTVFKGGDWEGTPGGRALLKTAAGAGIDLVFLPHTDGISSTRLRRGITVRPQEAAR